MDWSRIPSLAALRAFEAASRHGSFSGAAAELNVTHAAISQHVRSLEDYCSETLMTRQGRGMALTPAGQQLAEGLHAGFSQIAETVEALLLDTRTRPLNIAITPTFATNWLIPRLGSFWAQHPDIVINLTPGNVLVDLARDGFDMAIRYGRGDWPGVESELLTVADFVVVVAPELVAGREARGLQDVADLPWLWARIVPEYRTLVEAEGLDISNMRSTELESTDLVLAAARAGLGCSVQPRAIVEREIENGALIQVAALKNDEVGYYTVVRAGRETPPLKAFRRWLRRVAAAD